MREVTMETAGVAGPGVSASGPPAPGRTGPGGAELAAYGALVVAANLEWRTGDDNSAEAVLAAFDACVSQFGPALAGHWT